MIEVHSINLNDSKISEDIIVEYHHPTFNRITFNPEVCSGKPCIRGMRFPVASLLAYLSSGMTQEEILNEWHKLEKEDIQQALAFASQNMEEHVLPLEQSLTS